jgi:hypothetical protein
MANATEEATELIKISRQLIKEAKKLAEKQKNLMAQIQKNIEEFEKLKSK